MSGVHMELPISFDKEAWNRKKSGPGAAASDLRRCGRRRGCVGHKYPADCRRRMTDGSCRAIARVQRMGVATSMTRRTRRRRSNDRCLHCAGLRASTGGAIAVSAGRSHNRPARRRRRLIPGQGNVVAAMGADVRWLSVLRRAPSRTHHPSLHLPQRLQ